MRKTVYSFGPNASPDIKLALVRALNEEFSSWEISLDGEAVVVDSESSVSSVMTFARGFVAGFSPSPVPIGGARLAARLDPRQALTLPSTPAAKRKSDPPPVFGEIDLLELSGPRRYLTLPGVAPPSSRGR